MRCPECNGIAEKIEYVVVGYVTAMDHYKCPECGHDWYQAVPREKTKS